MAGGYPSGLGGPAVGVGLGGGGGGGIGRGLVDGGSGGGAAGSGRLWCGAGRGSAAAIVGPPVVAAIVVAGWEDVDGAEPGRGEVGPVLFGGVGRVHAKAVAASGVIVELGGDVGVHQGGVIDEGVPAVAAIVFGLDEEGGGRELVGGVGGVEFLVFRRDGQVGGIDDDGEVGAGVEVGVDVGGSGGGGDVVVVGMGAEEDGEVGAGGEAHDTDVGGIDVPFGGVGAGETHGLLGVLEVRGVGGIVAGVAWRLGNAVFDEDAGDADGVEPVAGVGAFAVGYEDAIAAAGKDEDRGAGVLAVGRIDGERGEGDVGEADDAAAADLVVCGLGGVGLGLGGLGRLGCGVRPEREREGSGLGAGGWEQGGGGEYKGCEAESGGEAFHADHTNPCLAVLRGLERAFGEERGLRGDVESEIRGEQRQRAEADSQGE